MVDFMVFGFSTGFLRTFFCLIIDMWDFIIFYKKFVILFMVLCLIPGSNYFECDV